MCINCSFFAYIFAVLLTDLSRLSCHSVKGMFLRMKTIMNTRHHAHKPVKQCNYWPDFRNGVVKRVKLRQRAKFRGDSSNHRRHMAYFDFSRWRPPPSWILKFLTVGLKTPIHTPKIGALGKITFPNRRFPDKLY